MPPLILGFLFLVGCVILAGALGRRLFVWLGVGPPSALTRTLLAIGLGLGALQVVPILLFAVGAGKPTVFWASAAALAIILIPDGIAFIRDTARIAARVTSLRWWERTLLLAFSIVAATVFIRAVCPVSSAD